MINDEMRERRSRESGRDGMTGAVSDIKSM
jgi:hypothetical protein